MTDQMMQFFSSLVAVEVVDVAGAYHYVMSEVHTMDLSGSLSFVYDKQLEKTIQKDYKELKKYYSGKAFLAPEAILKKYSEESGEFYILKCVITIMQYNNF